MPFKGFSKFRLKEHFRKMWPVYVIGCIICVILSDLLFTTTAPRMPYEQQVLIYVVDVYPHAELLEDMEQPLLEKISAEVDDTLREVDFQAINYNDPEVDMYSTYLIVARMSVGDGDVYIANARAASYLLGSEIELELDEYLEAGWMSEFDLKPVRVENEETGASFIGGLSLTDYEPLKKLGVMNDQEGAVLIIAGNGTNPETSMAVVEEMFRELSNGTYVADHTMPVVPKAE